MLHPMNKTHNKYKYYWNNLYLLVKATDKQVTISILESSFIVSLCCWHLNDFRLQKHIALYIDTHLWLWLN